ncbi:MAG: maltose alpha-D-glucosyltransferase, partial [Chitinivibrionales bacterium]|nr:maltose alpha-D-glucosyltransferase [Chitinivibrionales bacterium]MBD3356430.1 maltose alpha-D-glucosyltransferase [Chitinivibrionales bacterium]
MSEADPHWYKDAIIYELHVRAFRDSNADGVGDFRGLIEKLDYFQDLGVTAIWLLPFFPSPLRDDGYDIADYNSINTDYGTMRDFKDFLKAAHARGIRVIAELVLNHTSSEHKWFQRARKARPGSNYRDFYVWSESPDKYNDARIIFKDFETSNWAWDPVAKAYYWHRFYSHQPDLNFDNPSVRKALMRVIDFWFSMGVDGLRLDAVPYLYERERTNCENLTETHEFLRMLRAHVDERFEGKMLLAEANQWPEDAVQYFGEGDECHMAFHFPLMPRLFMAIHMEDSFPIVDILSTTPSIPDVCQWAMFLRNHDELTLEMVTDEERDYMNRVYAQESRMKLNVGIRRRLGPLLANNRRKIELMNILLFSFPGTPVVYYGDELGMGDNIYLGDRDGVRTPMQWSADRNAGFSSGNPQRLFLPAIIDPQYHYESINVETQEENLSSLLWWMKRVIAMRKQYRAFSRGDFHLVSSDNPKVLAFVRRHGNEHILVVANISRFTQVVHLDLAEFAGMIPEELFSGNDFPAIHRRPYVVTLTPYGHYWLELVQRERKTSTGEAESIPMLNITGDWTNLFTGASLKAFESSLLPAVLTRSGWRPTISRAARRASITDVIPLKEAKEPYWAVIVDMALPEGRTKRFCVPIAVATERSAQELEDEFPTSVLARVRRGDEEGIVYDGMVGR